MHFLCINKNCIKIRNRVLRVFSDTRFFLACFDKNSFSPASQKSFSWTKNHQSSSKTPHFSFLFKTHEF